MAVVFQKTKMLTDTPFHYCPGCTHGIIHRLVAEALDELGVGETAVGVAPVGCAVFAYNYFNCDMMEAAHGRAPAVATGIKRVQPGKAVFTYQGDGDLASIGAAEIVHAATRGEKITAIFVNNAIYGMTGGQMAPTTLPGQVTTTSPYGRDVDRCGWPVRVSEMLSTLNGPAYIARVSVHDVKHIRQAKAAIKRAFEMQLAGKGFTMVEVLSSCPTNWGKTPQEALQWVQTDMMSMYPLGVYKDIDAPATVGASERAAAKPEYDPATRAASAAERVQANAQQAQANANQAQTRASDAQTHAEQAFERAEKLQSEARQANQADAAQQAADIAKQAAQTVAGAAKDVFSAIKKAVDGMGKGGEQ